MDKINNSGKWTIGGVIVVVIIIVIILIAVFFHRQNQNAGSSPINTSTVATDNSNASTTEMNVTSTEPAIPPPPPAPVPAQTQKASSENIAPPVVINLLTPVANAQWVIGQQNPISWDNYPGITGQIVLLNASDKSEVGVITSETEPQQTSYIWNTRSYNLGRYGGLMKDVVPGTYLVEVEFDGNNLPPLIGGPITITN